MEEPVLDTRDARGVVTLTMNRPGNFNALGEEMLGAMQAALDRVADDESARVVVIAAAGKAFCPGHNLKEMIARPELAYYQQLFAQCSRMMLAIQKLHDGEPFGTVGSADDFDDDYSNEAPEDDFMA